MPEKAEPDAVSVSPAGAETNDHVAPLRLVDNVPEIEEPERGSATDVSAAVAELPPTRTENEVVPLPNTTLAPSRVSETTMRRLSMEQVAVGVPVIAPVAWSRIRPGQTEDKSTGEPAGDPGPPAEAVH